MKTCPYCNFECEDNANYCTRCGRPLNGESKVIYANPYDHTSEFEENDIKENKLFASLPYLFGFLGIICAYICSKGSKFTLFHIKQALRINIIGVLCLLVMCVLFWTILVPIVACIFAIILFVICMISFFSALQGKAKEALIVRGFKFLK